MSYRLEVDYAFNVRARKGERRERGTGRLIKCLIYRGTRDECFVDARGTYGAMTGGHSEVIAVRGYDEAAYKADPLNAVPAFIAAALPEA